MKLCDQDEYEKAVFALHRLHALLEDVFLLPQGTAGFPATHSPVEWFATQLNKLADEVTRAAHPAIQEEKP